MRYTSSGSLDDVVYFVRYAFEDSGSSAHATLLNSDRYSYALQCDPVTSTEFVAFNSVTTSTLKSWVQSSHGENWGSFTSSLESSMNSSLSSRVSSNPTTKYNFHSSSLSLDGLSILSGSDFWHAEIE